MMDINSILSLNNDTFRKSTDKNKSGYLFDTQINTAKNIVKTLNEDADRTNHVILAAKMQSGKTGVCNATVNIISQTELEKDMNVNKYFFISGMNDCGLKEQTHERLIKQVIGASEDNIYVGKRNKKNLGENKFFLLKNSDLMAYDGNIDNSVIFIDESHYGSNKKNILTKFLEKQGINWRDSSEMKDRNIYIVSVSATPFEEIVSDTKECKNIVELKPTDEYVGVSEFLNSGLVFDASKDDIESGEIFDMINDAYNRMTADGIAGIIFIRTRKIWDIKTDSSVANRFDTMELYSNGSKIEYDALNTKLKDLVSKNKFNRKIKNVGISSAMVEPFDIKPLIVFIKGAFRAGITIEEDFKDYIYMVYDYSTKSETTAQALLGRMCGYRPKNAEVNHTYFYVNKEFANMYSEWESDFQDRTKVPCNKMMWEWLPSTYSGGDTKIDSKCCGNVEIPLTDDEISGIYNAVQGKKGRVNFMKAYLPILLNNHGININYDYIGEAVLEGKNHYAKSSQVKRFEAFNKDTVVYQFRPERIKDFVNDTGRSELTMEDLGKKAVYCVLDANIYNNGDVITGNKRMLLYCVEVAQKKRVPNLHSMYKEHKDTSLSD